MTWRSGTRNPHTLYRDDEPMGCVFDEGNTYRVVETLNAGEAAGVRILGLEADVERLSGFETAFRRHAAKLQDARTLLERLRYQSLPIALHAMLEDWLDSPFPSGAWCHHCGVGEETDGGFKHLQTCIDGIAYDASGAWRQRKQRMALEGVAFTLPEGAIDPNELGPLVPVVRVDSGGEFMQVTVRSEGPFEITGFRRAVRPSPEGAELAPGCTCINGRGAPCPVHPDPEPFV